jgi:hypothetical protein
MRSLSSPRKKSEAGCTVLQGDQIERIFAYWAIVNSFGQRFENYRSSAIFGILFSTVPVMSEF